jgi:hypothetical protein
MRNLFYMQFGTVDGVSLPVDDSYSGLTFAEALDIVFRPRERLFVSRPAYIIFSRRIIFRRCGPCAGARKNQERADQKKAVRAEQAESPTSPGYRTRVDDC